MRRKGEETKRGRVEGEGKRRGRGGEEERT